MLAAARLRLQSTLQVAARLVALGVLRDGVRPNDLAALTRLLVPTPSAGGTDPVR